MPNEHLSPASSAEHIQRMLQDWYYRPSGAPPGGAAVWTPLPKDIRRAYLTQDLSLGGLAQAQLVDFAANHWSNESGPICVFDGLGSARGQGALATATVSSGGVTGVTIDQGGSGYTSANPPTVAFIGNGSGAAGTATISGGAVTGVTITAAGSGYGGPPIVKFVGGQPVKYPAGTYLYVRDFPDSGWWEPWEVPQNRPVGSFQFVYDATSNAQFYPAAFSGFFADPEIVVDGTLPGGDAHKLDVNADGLYLIILNVYAYSSGGAGSCGSYPIEAKLMWNPPSGPPVQLADVSFSYMQGGICGLVHGGDYVEIPGTSGSGGASAIAQLGSGGYLQIAWATTPSVAGGTISLLQLIR